jgi:hypothetical protein
VYDIRNGGHYGKLHLRPHRLHDKIIFARSDQSPILSGACRMTGSAVAFPMQSIY